MPTTTLPEIKFQERQDLIDALKARRSWAKALDARRLREHKAEEKAAVEAIRKKCREVASLSYTDLVALDRKTYGELVKFEKPSCPSALLPRLDEILRTLEISQQKQFTFRDGEMVHHLLTFDPDATTEMC